MAKKKSESAQVTSGREKVRAMQAAGARRERRQRSMIIAAAAVVAAVLVAVVAITVANVSGDKVSASEVVVPASGVSELGGITASGPVRSDDPPVQVVEYLDYQCPACQQFDAQVGPYLKEQVAAGNIEMVYHPLGFLDSQSSTRYSTRSAGAAYCLADQGGDIQAFSDTLYADQPPEGGSGLPDADLVAAARQAGAGQEVEECITSQRHAGYVGKTTEQAFDLVEGGAPLVAGTPTVVVAGQKVESSLSAVRAAVEAARA